MRGKYSFFMHITWPSPAGMERSGIPVRVHGMGYASWYDILEELAILHDHQEVFRRILDQLDVSDWISVH